MANQHRNAKSIFWKSLEFDSDRELEAFLNVECGADSDLRARVEQLLAAGKRSDSFLAPPAAAESNSVVDVLGTQIGPYMIREQIGEGGMGIVYVAEQAKPVERRVALKIIKPGMDTKEVIARFEAERQALAFMEHPNIARVIDAGATESGRPYFVMELVRGIPITEFCDQLKATTRERLELFKTVCDAVQHAHQKGIIHRDIKPSNVLVTQVSARPVVKVIDFGLAKAISGQRLTEKTLYTGFMKLMGTPAYMSPEQAGLSGLDIDTRSDIYSLGVLLYELLTGTTPLDKTAIQKQAYDELCRHIREVDAPKPSTRFSTLKDAERTTVAQLRQVEQHRLRNLLHGDLDRVVLKAIEKDREQRYGSPQDFAEDVARFLADKPVLAVPSSQWYLTQKYVRRHKVAITTSALILAFLLLATAFSSWQAIRATTANRIAEDKTVAATRSERETRKALHAAEVAHHEATQALQQRQRIQYAANIQLADQLRRSRDGTPEQIEKLLAAWIPTSGEQDLRDLAWRFLWTQLHFSAHEMVSGVNAISISPAGNLILADKVGIREWNQAQESFLTLWSGDASLGNDQVALSDCGRWAAIRKNAVIELIEIATGNVLGKVPGTHARFAPGGKFALVWRNDTKLGQSVDYRLWDFATATSKPLDHINDAGVTEPGFERIAAVSPDGSSHALGVYGGFWMNLHTAGHPVPMRWFADTIKCAAWSPDGRLLACGRGGVLHFRKREAPDQKLVFNLQRSVSVVAFSNDGTRLALGGRGTVDLYDISHFNAEADDDLSSISSADLPKLVDTLHAHIGDVRKLVFSQDDQSLATLDSTGVAKVWRLDQRSNAFPLTDKVDFVNDGIAGIQVKDVGREVHISSLQSELRANGEIRPGDRILSISEVERDEAQEITAEKDANDVRRLLRGATGTRVRLELASPSSPERRLVELERQQEEEIFATFGMAFARNTNEIIVGSRYGAYRRSIDGRIGRYYPAKCSLLVQTSRDGKLLAFVESKELVIWDLSSDSEYRRLPACVGEHPTLPNEASVCGVVCFSPDGRFIAVGTGFPFNTTKRRSDIRVWDTATFQEIGDPLFEGSFGIGGVTFSPDSKHLVASDHEGRVRIWRTSNWELVDTLLGSGRSLDVDISPNGRFIAQGGYRGIVVWDLKSRKEMMSERDHLVADVEFSRDGRNLVTPTLRGETCFWDIQTGMKLIVIKLGPEKLVDCEFTPDGRKLAVLGRRDSLWMYDIADLEEIDRHPLTIASLQRRAQSQIQNEHFAKAEATFRRILHMQSASFPPGHPELHSTRAQIADSLKKQGKPPPVDGGTDAR